MYSYGPLHMAEQKQDDQLEHTYSSYVRIRDVDLKTCQRRWTRGKSGERGLGISVLVARYDDDNDDIPLVSMVKTLTFAQFAVIPTLVLILGYFYWINLLYSWLSHNNLLGWWRGMCVSTRIPKNFLLYTSSSSCHAAGTDFPDSHLPFISVIHHFRQAFKTTSCVHTELW